MDSARTGMILLVVVVSVTGCKKGARETTPATKYAVNGAMDDWGEHTCVLTEAGKTGTKFPNKIDVKQVHIDNDSSYLYVFLQCSPTPAQRYEVEQTSGGIMSLFFDIDNDRTTGSKGAEVHFHPDKQDGLEVGVQLEIFVTGEWRLGQGMSVHHGCGWKASLWNADRQEFVDQDDKDLLRHYPYSTEDTPELIADGKDGVELCIPLEQLGVQPGATVRILLREAANSWGDKEGFNEVTLKLNR